MARHLINFGLLFASFGALILSGCRSSEQGLEYEVWSGIHEGHTLKLFARHMKGPGEIFTDTIYVQQVFVFDDREICNSDDHRAARPIDLDLWNDLQHQVFDNEEFVESSPHARTAWIIRVPSTTLSEDQFREFATALRVHRDELLDAFENATLRNGRSFYFKNVSAVVRGEPQYFDAPDGKEEMKISLGGYIGGKRFFSNFDKPKSKRGYSTRTFGKLAMRDGRKIVVITDPRGEPLEFYQNFVDADGKKLSDLYEITIEVP